MVIHYFYRYDLLCVEGLVRALKVFLQKTNAPLYKSVEPKSGNRQQLFLKESTQQVRKFVVAAVLRDITFTQERYQLYK